MTAAVQPPYPSTGSAWEEQIVPTLRKRLEQESRILENRLSVHSLTSNSRDEHYQQPNPSSTSQSAQSRQQQQPSQSDSRSPTPSSRVQGNRNYSDTYRQTAIPRPNSSMAKDSLYSADRPHTAATIVAPGPSNVSRDGSSSNISGSGSNRVPFTRSRTRSTPYPFENDEETSAPAPNGRRTPNGGLNYGGRHASGTADSSALNGIPTPASSRANSPMVMNSKLPSQPPPSKIPQRKRARSTSNSDTPMKASVGRAAGSKIAKRAGRAGQDHITFPPSPETSPDIWRDQSDAEPPRNLHPGDKIRDEAPPFNPNRLSAAPSFEEREFEHWYRGEGRDGGGRNGGRGEIKVGKAHTQKEMLEIAVGGYDLGADDRWMSSRRKQQAALDSLNMRRREAEQMDYVPHERELSDMEADYSEDAHDQAAGEDPYEYYYTTHDDAPPAPEPSKPPRLPSTPLPQPAPPSAIPVAQTQPRPSMDSRPQSPSSSASHGTAKQVRKSTGHAANNSESSRKGGRPSAAKVPSTPRKSQPRQRAPSRPSNVGERGPITADAIPPWGQSPRPPTGGNWDDMVLPAVAKKMGLNNASQPDITMLGTDTVKQKEKERQQIYEPAAGTFGYDAAKRRDEAPKRKDKPAGIMTDWEDTLLLPPAKPSSPPANHDFPPRQDSPPPFSSYSIGIHEKEPEPEVASAAPSQHSQPSSESRQPRPPPVSLSKEELKQRGKELRKSKPAIVVTSPSEMATPMGRAGQDEDEGAGCCKCVIM